MKIIGQVFAMLVVALCAAVPASAYLEEIYAPPSVEVGQAFDVVVFGALPNPCWEVISSDQSLAPGVITIDIHTANTAPPDVACIQVLVFFDLDAEITIPSAGEWVLRVVEHRTDPYRPNLPDFVMETKF